MFCATQRRLLALSLLLVFGTVISGSAQQADTPPLRVLVKMTSRFATAVETALPADTLKLSKAAPSNTEIGVFQKAHSVRSVTPLYPDIVRAKKLRGLSDAQFATAIQRRFPHRASRWRRPFNPPEISRTYVLEIDNGAGKDLQLVLRELRADANVEFAEEDHVIRVQDLPNDPYLWSTGTWGQSYDDLWGIKKIGAPAAWNISAGDGIVVAVVDTGIDYNHPDIAANIWTNASEIAGNGIDDDGNGYADDVRGWDFVGASYQYPTQSNNPADGYGHGTHVAGTIAALGNNGIGVIGIAWRARVMAVRGLDSRGYGTDSTLAPALIYAADNGADIISNSWAGTGSSQAIAEAVQYAYSLGAVIVAAAGNDTDDARNYYPANLPQVITVAATDANDAKAYFSNWGSKIDVAAPGVDILSLRAANTNMGTPVGDDYTRASGTSMATPHVSGTAALILSQHPDYSNEDVRQVLRVSTDLSSGSFDTFFGYGRLNAANALAVASVLEAKILEPVDGSVVSVPTTISGVARGNGFASYSLEYGVGEAPFSWTQLQSGTSPVSGSLGTFDPTRLMNGVYTLRLTAYDVAGHAFVDQIHVTARAISISNPEPPLVPTTATVIKPGVTLSVSGTAIGSNFQNYRLEWAAGIIPADGWSSTGITLSGGGLSPVTNDVLGSWDTSAITEAGYYTIRLTVVNASYSAQTATLVYLEPSLFSSGWPVWLDHAPDTSRSGIVPASDAAGTSRLTLLKPGDPTIPTATQFRSYGTDGSLLTAFDLVGYPLFQPAAGDLDGLAGDEVIVPEAYSLRWFGADNTSTAMPVHGPSGWANVSSAQLVMEDLDGDSELETIGMGVYPPNNAAYVFAWRRDGTQMNANFPITLANLNPYLTWGNPRVLVGDIDGDGKKEIIAVEGTSSSSFTLRLFANDGTPRAWLAPPFNGYYNEMVLADLDHNGKLETLLLWDDGSQKQLDVRQPDGTERPGWPVLVLPRTNNSSMAVGDLNRDGNEEIVISNEGLYVLKPDGIPLSSTWPWREPGWNSLGPVLLADIDGDGYPEILTVRDRFFSFSGPLLKSTSPDFSAVEVPAHRSIQRSIGSDGTVAPSTVQTTAVAQGNSTLYEAPQLIAFRLDTTIARSWDLMGSNGNQPYYQTQLTVGDFNHDGLTEIAAVYQLISGGGTSGYLVEGVATLLSTGAAYNPTVNDWPMFLQNPRNTAVRIHDVAPPAVRITSPADGSVLCDAVAITANATDNVGVAGVQLQLDGVNLGPELTAAPYQFAWDTSTTSLGAHTLTAVARDSAGNAAASAGVNVTIFPAMSATVSPSALSFGDLPLNSTSAPQTVTITNTGGQPLPLVLAITGDFAETNDCGAVLGVGASCVVSVTFTPAVRGAETGTLSVTSQGFAPLVVSLSGTGLLAKAELSPASIEFGAQGLNTTSAAHTITLTNTGDMPTAIASIATTGDFAQTNNCASSLATGTSCTIAVTFRPTVRGAATGTLSLTGTVNATANLSGTGLLLTASFSPASLNFDNQDVNTTSAPLSLTVTNDGEGLFYIDTIGSTGDFTPTRNCASSLAVGASCTMQVTFSPKAMGSRSGTLTLGGNFSGSPAGIPLSGTGIISSPSLTPSSLAFGNQPINTTSAPRTITLTNTAKAAVNLTVQVSGDFVQASNCLSPVPVGGSCVINVTFKPKTRGDTTGTLTVTGGFTGSTLSAALSGTGQAKLAAVSPTSLSFGGQLVNTTSAPQTVTYTNTGDLPVSISAITVTGSYASSFAQTNDCGTSLAVGASCSISVTFSPTTRAYITGTVSITGDVASSVVLSGTGQGMAATLSPTSFNFGGQPLNTTSYPWTFTYTNTGELPISISAVSVTGPFAQTNNCGTVVDVGSSCKINVTFTPTVRGPVTGALSVNRSFFTTSALSGTGQLLTATFSPSSLNFGNQDVNTSSAPLSLTVTNNGDASFLINSLGYGGNFSPTSNCMGFLSVGASCTMQVTFKPTSMGSISSELSVGGTFTGSPANIPLSGTGVISPPSLTPRSLAFGNQLLNTTSSAQSITVTNAAKVAVTIGSIQVSGDFAQTNNCPGSLPVGGSCAVTLTFTPKTRGAQNGMLTVNGGFTGTSVSVPLAGTGQAMLATTLPSSLSFGGQLLDTTSLVQTIAYTNTGDVPISVSAISTTGSFAQNNNCATLAVGESCTINVTFTPTARGGQSGTLSITGSVNSNVALSGTGQIISGAVSPTSLGFGGQLLNTTSPAQAVTYTNDGDLPLSISAISVSGDFAQTNNCGTTLPVGSSCTISVTFTPTARGNASGTLSINGVASSSAALTGTGQITAAALLPVSLSFGGQQVNTTSAPQGLTYTNTGDVPVSLSAISVTGSFAQTNNCGTSLAVGASCAINVTFTPTARGNAVGALSISGSVDSSVALSGTGQIVSGTVAPASLSFGGQQLNTSSPPQALTYTNSGDLPVSISGVAVSGSFAQNNDCPTSLATGASCTINVTFTPTVRGAASGTLAVSGSANASVSLSGTGQAVIATFSPTALALGNQEVNTTSAPQSVTLVNSGDLPFSIQSWNWGGPFPTVTDCPATIPAGTKCTFDVTFAPTTMGTVPGTSLTINGTFPGSPATITLSGTGIVSPPSLSPNPVAFGNQLLKTASAAQTIVMANMSRSVISITAIQVTGQFAQTNNCGTSLAVGGSCAINVTFTPTVAGDQSGNLIVTGGFTGTSVNAALAGTGVLAPIASVSPSTLSFASRVVTTTSGAQAVSLTNTGEAALTITSISASGDFAQTNNCGTTLSVNATCKINVTFRPVSAGARTGTVTIADNSYTGSPQIVSLSGTGLDYAVSVSPSSTTVTGGQSTTVTATVTALGGAFNSSVALKCSGLPASTTCSFSPSSVSPKSTFANSVLKISTSAGKTPPGDYTLTITGTSGSLQQTTILNLTVN